MALAHLEWSEDLPNQIVFTGDIGSNEFYELHVGPWRGARELESTVWVSPLARAERAPFDGGFPIQVPASRLPPGPAGVQLVSYRDRARNGATASDVVQVFHLAEEGLSVRFSLARSRNVSFAFGERARAYTRAASLEAPVMLSRGLSVLFAGSIPVFGGGTRPVFSAGRDIQLRFRRNAAESLPRAIFDWSLGAAGADAPARGSERMTNVARDFAVTIPADRLAALPTGRDLQLEGKLRWPGGRVQTASVTATLRLARNLFLGNVDDQGGHRLGLFDPVRDRAYWNRFFVGPLETSAKAVRWTTDLECRYYVRGPLAGDTHGRVETRLKLEEIDPDDLTQKIAGAIKSGFEMAAEPLDELVPLLDSSATPLDADELDALVTGIGDDAGRQATQRIKVHGTASSRVEIWALPVMELRRVVFREVDGVDANGQVLGTRPVERQFPFAAAIRFLVLRSSTSGARAADDGLAIEGYDVVADSTVPLSAVALEAR